MSREDFSWIPRRSWISPGLEVRHSSIEGAGVFTTRVIAEGQTVIVWGGVVVTLDEFREGRGLAHSNVGLAEGYYLASPPETGLSVDDYMNHSCDPNLWLVDEITLVARREIPAGAELTIDYAIELLDEAYVMKQRCDCGARQCRGVITGVDWKLPAVRAYGTHVAPFVMRRIVALDKGDAAGV